VIGIFIDHDLIGIPQPVAAKTDVIRRNAEVESAKPKSPRPAARQVPHVASAETAREVPVLPRMVKMVVRIVAAGIVPDPLAVGVNVWRIRMPLFVHVGMIRFDGMPGTLHPSRPVSRRAWSGLMTASMTLRENRNTAQQHHCEKSNKVFHIHLQN
jgi:hypothetical protein